MSPSEISLGTSIPLFPTFLRFVQSLNVCALPVPTGWFKQKWVVHLGTERTYTNQSQIYIRQNLED